MQPPLGKNHFPPKKRRKLCFISLLAQNSFPFPPQLATCDGFEMQNSVRFWCAFAIPEA